MEYEWERKFPFLIVDSNIVKTLFSGIVDPENITLIKPINEGCRTTNYIIETKFNEKYILKIYFESEANYKKEIKLLSMLKDKDKVLVPKIYKVSKNKAIGNREYVIYQFMQGETIGQAIKNGYVLEEKLVRDVAINLAKIHNYKFDKAGALDENLNVLNQCPSFFSYYNKLLDSNAKTRLGEIITDKINHIIHKNKKILLSLDDDIRLIHGDFQGTNILVRDGQFGGILDWELAMAGHPLSDIGQFFRYEEYFDKSLIKIFEEEYKKNSSYKLDEDWYKLSKLRDLATLIQLIGAPEDLPNKYKNIKKIIVNILKEIP